MERDVTLREPGNFEPRTGRATTGVAPEDADARAEARLVDALKDGDEAAYGQLVREHGPRMLCVVRRLLDNEEDAREVLQDAFTSAFRGIQGFSSASRLSTWLYRVAVNAALMRRRSQRRFRAASFEDLLPRFDRSGHALDPARAWAATPTSEPERAELIAKVRDSIDQLPETYRTVLVLRDMEGLDTHETASILGVAVTTVKTRTHRARQALRTLLDPYMKP